MRLAIAVVSLFALTQTASALNLGKSWQGSSKVSLVTDDAGAWSHLRLLPEREFPLFPQQPDISIMSLSTVAEQPGAQDQTYLDIRHDRTKSSHTIWRSSVFSH